LTFWGLTRTQINENLILTPILYCLTVSIVLIFSIIISGKLLNDQKERSIFIAASLIGNTGNLGIPLGIALYGEQSVAYTSIINIANVFFIYTVGIFFYAKEKFDIKGSLKQMFKIPILWFAALALIVNYLNIEINTHFNRFLEMGAYATIVIQLMIFGIYMAQIKIKYVNYTLSLKVTIIKHIILPLTGIVVVLLFKVEPFIALILLMQLSVPLAVNNVNIAALYECKPHETTQAVLVTTLFFIVFIYAYIYLFALIV
jgi:predicted permease